MYESYFGLSQRPFAAAPLVERFFPASSIDAARQALARCIDRAEGVGVCIAAAGMGKTLLLEVLADQFSEPFGALLLSAGAWASRRELLQAICFELKIPYQGLDEGELRLALVNQLTRTEKHRRGIVLLVDEAQTLSVPLLEELRMLSNLVHAGEPRVRLVIAGNLRLEELLAAPHLESFSQRLSCRTYLEPFDRAETTDYVRFQIAVAGGRVEQVFEPTAVDAVYRATDGVPRLVNQLCDHALLMAYSQEQRPVVTHWIEKAWADLQQLPVPWQEPPAAQAGSGSASSVVEFGALSDDLDDFNPAASHEFTADEPHESEYESQREAAAEAEPVADQHTAQATFNATRMEAAHDEVPPSVLSADQLADAAETTCEDEDDAWDLVGEHADTVRRAEARFEELASQFEALQAEETPAETNEFTEAELSFDDEDPFDEFDEEEPLVDPYAAAAEAAWPFIDSAAQGETPAETIDAGADESIDHEAHEPQWELPPTEQQLTEQQPEEPIAEEPAAEDEDEEPWEAVEEWSVHDSYREAGTSAMPEILSITPLPPPVPQQRPQPLAEACQEEPTHAESECGEAECAEPAADSANETLAEVVIDPYEGLTELGERLRQEALRLTETQRPTAEAVQDFESAEHDEPAELAEPTASFDVPMSHHLPPEATADDVEPNAAWIETSEAPQEAVTAPGPVDQPAEAPEVEEPIELHQGKLTLAEAIRRRKEASAPAAHVQTAAPEEPAAERQPSYGESANASPEQQPPQLDEPSPASEQTVETTCEDATCADESSTSDDQVVIVLDESAQIEQTESEDAPRVHREDYRTLFERLRRG